MHTFYAPYHRKFAPAGLSAHFFLPIRATFRLGRPSGPKQILTHRTPPAKRRRTACCQKREVRKKWEV
jgi:hypothetical protein